MRFNMWKTYETKILFAYHFDRSLPYQETVQVHLNLWKDIAALRKVNKRLLIFVVNPSFCHHAHFRYHWRYISNIKRKTAEIIIALRKENLSQQLSW